MTSFSEGCLTKQFTCVDFPDSEISLLHRKWDDTRNINRYQFHGCSSSFNIPHLNTGILPSDNNSSSLPIPADTRRIPLLLLILRSILERRAEWGPRMESRIPYLDRIVCCRGRQ